MPLHFKGLRVSELAWWWGRFYRSSHSRRGWH